MIKILFWVIVIFFSVCFLRTWQLNHSKNQELFLIGTFPNPALNGFYEGHVAEIPTTSWQGKKFDVENNKGINIFKKDTLEQERYPFKSLKTKGVHDKDQDVLAIDYNIPENPFWLKLILDEVVQVGPTSYLGKLQLRIIPNYPFTLIFFTLEK
jgi:hypothetical protein